MRYLDKNNQIILSDIYNVKDEFLNIKAVCFENGKYACDIKDIKQHNDLLVIAIWDNAIDRTKTIIKHILIVRKI